VYRRRLADCSFSVAAIKLQPSVQFVHYASLIL